MVKIRTRVEEKDAFQAGQLDTVDIEVVQPVSQLAEDPE